MKKINVLVLHKIEFEHNGVLYLLKNREAVSSYHIFAEKIETQDLNNQYLFTAAKMSIDTLVVKIQS